MYVNQFQETFRDGVEQGLAQGCETGEELIAKAART